MGKRHKRTKEERQARQEFLLAMRVFVGALSKDQKRILLFAAKSLRRGQMPIQDWEEI
jgi:hypothetical protein